MRRRDLVLLSGAALIGICLNQLTFVYAIKLTTATTVALLFGTLPVIAGLFAFALGIDRVGLRFWLAAVLALVRRRAGGGRFRRRVVEAPLGRRCSRSARRSPGRSTPSLRRRCSAATRRSA